MTDSVIKYVGVDGCKVGWVGVGLDDVGEACVKVCKDFSEILECFGGASLILVDMPIGLPEGVHAYRCCDNKAREKLGRRQSSVFTVPSREFVDEFERSKSATRPWAYSDANKWIKGRRQDAKLISQQAFHITGKIAEVDKTLQALDRSIPPEVREAHPEICFWALNNKNVMANSKKDGWGFIERFRVVKRLLPDTNIDGVFEEVRREFSNSKVGADDILDAIALAITAKIGCENGFMTLPDKPPTDNSKKNLPMEMVYALLPEGTPC